MSLPPVTFLHPFPEQLDAARRYHSERDHDRFSTGAWVWIVQTWLLLREAGWDVGLSAELPRTGVVVYHPNLRSWPLMSQPEVCACRDHVLIAAVADRIRAPPADLFIVQNGYYADRPNAVFVPHWPQPGLIPRDPARGERLVRLSYKGLAVNLHEMFRGEVWSRGLEALGIAWEPDTVGLMDDRQQDILHRWHDYARDDAVLAVRTELEHLWMNRPASKLVNAWHAGVPALLGPEQAYRELRRSELDYLEVASVDEALAALDKLKRSPALYRAMVENGHLRAAEFSRAQVRARWEALLFGEVPRRIRDGVLPLARRLPWDVSEDFPGWESITSPKRLC